MRYVIAGMLLASLGACGGRDDRRSPDYPAPTEAPRPLKG